MATFILKRKYFDEGSAASAADKPLGKKQWLIDQGKRPDSSGKFPKSIWEDEALNKSYEEYRAGFNNKNVKDSIFKRGRAWAGEVWANHKVPIIVGTSLVAAAGIGYGAKKHYDKKQAEEEMALSNDLVRQKIVYGNDYKAKKENKNNR